MVIKEGLQTRQIDLVLDLIDDILERSITLEKRIKCRLEPYMSFELPCQPEAQKTNNTELAPVIRGMYTKLGLIRDSQTSINSMLNKLEI